ncbi:hypothetical protein ABT026_30685 [Streptomyces sp. NPDC002734]|uniref:hypothetical protein n=1 Tax=Streptomyces sp. NPDC002734 TaxID=3154426 RepID=UPI003323262A
MTEAVLRQLLEQNEGFEDETTTRQKNFQERRQYRITGGQLRYRATGKTSWADSRFDDEYVATDDQARRFLRPRLDKLNTDGL